MNLRNLARKAYPDIAELDRKHRPVIKAHRRGSAELYRRKREVMNRALGGT